MQREQLESKWIEEIKNTNLEGLQTLDKLFGGISKIEQYNINTTEERIAEIKELQEQKRIEEEAEKKRKQEEERRNKPNVYTLNDTMRLLGHQRIVQIFEKYKDMYEEVLKAHPYEGTFGICIDMFSLGILCGKKIDRERRKKKRPLLV